MRYGYGSTADFKVYLYPYGGWLRNPAPVDGQNPIIYRVEKPSKVSFTHISTQPYIFAGYVVSNFR